MQSNQNWAASGKTLAVVTITLFVILALAPSAGAQTYKVLYTFTGGPDGAQPNEVLIFDGAGNLYSNTVYGGTYGAGTVFKLSPNPDGSWTESVLYSFTGGSDGRSPNLGGLVFDTAGNLYGTCHDGGKYGGGVLYKLAPNPDGTWTQTVIHQFKGRNDGSSPFGAPVFDKAGNLYGTAPGAGHFGYGTVFKLTPSPDDQWTYDVIHQFADKPAWGPWVGLFPDAAGNLYGTTRNDWQSGQGCSNPPLECGTVYKMTPAPDGKWTFKVIHRFSGGKHGADPGTEGLVSDSEGTLYGGTEKQGAYGHGLVFKLTPTPDGKWSYRILHQFHGQTDGGNPIGRLVRNEAGNVYGTTIFGGAYGQGVVFKLTPNPDGSWGFTVVYTFTGSEGAAPVGGLTLDDAGNLYGAAQLGGAYGAGVVYEITP
jgi:uncharacterized repeat protein (TIGR03803 family)